MMMSQNKEKKALGVRISEHRLGGDIVPVSPLSSTYDGLATECTAGSVAEYASAKTASVPRIVLMKELPVSSRLDVTKATSGRRGSGQAVDGNEHGPSGVEFVLPAQLTREREGGRLRPGPLSYRKKRSAVAEQEDVLSGEDTDPSCVSLMSTASTVSSTVSGVKRKRGRPPTIGEYVGLAAAKAELIRQERENMELQAEREMIDRTNEVRALRPLIKSSQWTWGR